MTELERPTLFDLTDNDLLDKIASNIPIIQGEINNKKIIFLSCVYTVYSLTVLPKYNEVT